MRRELMNKQREEQAEADGEAEVDEKSEIDSIDSLICMCFSHAQAILPRS
jgi:hypothetical protein